MITSAETGSTDFPSRWMLEAGVRARGYDETLLHDAADARVGTRLGDTAGVLADRGSSRADL
jgi:hypothetical protein